MAKVSKRGGVRVLLTGSQFIQFFPPTEDDQSRSDIRSILERFLELLFHRFET